MLSISRLMGSVLSVLRLICGDVRYSMLRISMNV